MEGLVDIKEIMTIRLQVCDAEKSLTMSESEC